MSDAVETVKEISLEIQDICFRLMELVQTVPFDACSEIAARIGDIDEAMDAIVAEVKRAESAESAECDR